MKKLLTIVALALVLCLGVSAVLADGETQRKEMGVKFGDAFTNGSAAFVAAVNASRAGEALIGGHQVTTDEVDVQSALADALADAAHAEYTIITLRGQKLKEENNATYQLITDADKLVVGKTYYIQSVDKDGKVQKDDKGNVKYEALKDSAELGKVYDKTDNYQYTNDGFESFNVRVMVTPHDKNGTPKTVTKDGKEMIVYTCSVCGKEWDPQAKADPATCKHENWGWVTVVEATCLKEGKQQYQCLDCGKTEGRTDVIAKKGHNVKDYEVSTLVAPHCVANGNGVGTVVNGYIYASCTECGSRFKKELSIYEYRKILVDELGWTEYEASGWTCHDFSLKAVKAPTCDDWGYNYYICSICHTEDWRYNNDLRPLTANYILTSAPNCKTIKVGDEIVFKCSNCGSASMNHPVITVKVDQDMIDKLKVQPEVPITVNKTLKQTYRYPMQRADGTGEVLVKEEETFADVTATGYLNHSGDLKQVDEKKAYIAGRPGVKVEDAVCGDTILNKWQCSVCESKEIVKQVKKITHNWGAYKAVLDTGSLKKWERACSICGQVDDAIYAEEAPDKACAEGKHDYHPLYAANARCNGLRAVIDAFETVKIELVCSICGDQKIDYWTIEHEWELVPGSSKPATCEDEGFNAYECAICHAVCVESVAMADHDLVAVAEKPATCKEAGYEAYWKCSVCGDLFADEDGLDEIDAPIVLPIDKEAHVWDEGKETVKPTTETEGEKTFTCTICGATKTEKVAKLTPAAAYTLENVKFSGNILSGSIKHKDGTKVAEKLSIRVTFFTAGNNYMTTAATIYADGTFEAEGAGDIEAITLVAYATDKVVNPADVANLTKLDAKEIIVK